MDRTLFQMKLTATTAHVALAERDLAAAGPPTEALAGARENVRKAARGLVELGELFNDVTEPGPAMRECLACGKTVMTAARRCGFCWTKIVVSANG
ncbi:MAG: hypothetical protein JWM53_1055 [bacterium]|nr:hypothetical protein [bacterium]